MESCQVHSLIYYKKLLWSNIVEAGGFLVKQKARGGGGGGRKKKPLPSTEGTSSPGEGSAKEGTPGAEDTQASPSPSSPPAIAGGRTGDPFEEAEKEEVLLIQRLHC